jgi:DNA (cytosine-5)-methyltransferase 1
MRHANNNRYPRFIVWENVPGAFSSNRGEDFRRVLSEVAEADIPIPANGKWANAGLVVLSDRQITWRVLDAQFWGVPQRRHRIFLVADFGGRCAAEILFDETRLSGTAQSGGKKEKGAAASFDEGYRVYDGRGRGDGKIASCITSDHDSRPSDYMHIVCAGFNGHKSTSASIQYASNRAPTIESNMPPNVAYAAFMAGQGAKAGGIGYSKDTAPTLKSTASGNLAPTLVMATAQANAEIIEGLSLTLNCAHEQPIVCWPPVCQTLTRRMDGGPSDKDMHNVIVDRYTLRRLMPIECERLQGFPDKWTEGHSDAARYHMIGNSVAVPCVDFIMQGIAATLEGDKSHEQ